MGNVGIRDGDAEKSECTGIRAEVSTRQRSATLLLLAAALLLTAFSRARAADSSGARLVAIHADRGGDVIVAYADSLVWIHTTSGEQSPIALPSSVSRVDAFASSTEGTLYLAAQGSGIWVSDDQGKTWRSGNAGLAGGKVGGLAAHADQGRTVYAYVVAEGIHRSEDAGRSWQLMDAGPEDMTGPFIHTDMPGSMQTGWLFAATKHGISRSMDCFCLWRDTGTLAAEVYALTYDPDRPERLFAAADSGILRSDDGGEGWAAASAPVPAIRTLSHAMNGALYAGSAGGEVFVSTDAARSWRRVHGFPP